MKKSFLDWLATQTRRDDPIGDLANDFGRDPPPERIITPGAFYDWVRYRHTDVAPECLQAITEAAAEWRGRQSSVSLATRFAVLQRDGYACQLCGRAVQDGVKLEVDHKIARSKGGTSDESNLWTLCFDCNRGKSDREL